MLGSQESGHALNKTDGMDAAFLRKDLEARKKGSVQEGACSPGRTTQEKCRQCEQLMNRLNDGCASCLLQAVR